MSDFTNLAKFGAHLLTLQASAAVAAHHGLEQAAQLIERTAKDEFGVYQPSAGDFNAWSPLEPETQKDRVRQGYTPDDPLLRSGELRDSIKHEVAGLEAVIGSEDDVMVYQEVGTSTIPPRPVLGPAAVRKERAVGRILGKAVGRAIAGQSLIQYGAEGALSPLGE